MEQQVTHEEGVVTHDKTAHNYGNVMYAAGIISCFIALLAPVLILLFPNANILNPTMIFGAIFSGQTSSEIWLTAGVHFEHGTFWPLFRKNLFTPDGFAMFGIALACSSAFWALIPVVGGYAKKKSWFYMLIAVFVMLLIALSMTGLISME